MAVNAICLWPGLPAAWLLGAARGLLISLFFAWSVCLLMLATFVWPDWISAVLLRFCWILAVSLWFFSAAKNCWQLPKLQARFDSHSHEALKSAQVEYLRGNWFEAEALLLNSLHSHPRDAEAMLLLVGVLRRTQRFNPALRRLKQLELLDGSVLWRYEIRREQVLIEQSIASAQAEMQAELQAEQLQSEQADESSTDEESAEILAANPSSATTLCTALTSEMPLTSASASGSIQHIETR